MAHATPTRPALADLNVNTVGTPSKKGTLGKETSSQKRQIREVEDPEDTRPVSRVRLSPSRSKSPVKEQISQREVQTNIPITVDPPSDPMAPAHSHDAAPEPAEELEEGASQQSYKDSVSSVADFDPDDTMESQQTAATEVTQPVQSRASLHAETLRLRLRLAHFKVKTNQTHIPLSQLRISTSEAEDFPTPGASPQSTDEQPSLPKLLPAPVLRPTAYSAQTISHTQIPSSPPSSTDNSPAKTAENEVFRTPALPRRATHFPVRQTSSPPESPDRLAGKDHFDEDDLTSSAIRGKAAIGLLGLRQER